jgi:hypothetical protein
MTQQPLRRRRTRRRGRRLCWRSSSSCAWPSSLPCSAAIEDTHKHKHTNTPVRPHARKHTRTRKYRPAHTSAHIATVSTARRMCRRVLTSFWPPPTQACAVPRRRRRRGRDEMARTTWARSTQNSQKTTTSDDHSKRLTESGPLPAPAPPTRSRATNRRATQRAAGLGLLPLALLLLPPPPLLLLLPPLLAAFRLVAPVEGGDAHNSDLRCHEQARQQGSRGSESVLEDLGAATAAASHSHCEKKCFQQRHSRGGDWCTYTCM